MNFMPNAGTTSLVDSKLIHLLRSFFLQDPVELKRLKRFVHSKWLVRNQKTIDLFNYIIALGPEFNSPKMSRDVIINSIGFANERELKNKQSDLLKVIEKYLVFSQLSVDKKSHDEMLAQIYFDRGLTRYSNHLMLGIDRVLNSSDIIDSEYYFDQFKTHKKKEELLYRKNLRSYSDNLEQSIHNLDIGYMIERLRLSCELVNRKRIFQNKNRDDIRICGTVPIPLQEISNIEFSGVKLYSNLLRLLLNREVKDFKKLRKNMKDQVSAFSIGEQRDIYTLALNFCIPFIIDEGKQAKEFALAYKALIMEMDEMDLLLDNGQMQPSKFKNIIKIAILTKDYKWVKKLIDDNGPKLPDSRRDQIIKYNTGYLEFAQGNFKKAIPMLMAVDDQDLFYNIGALKLLIMMHYEEGDHDYYKSNAHVLRLLIQTNPQLGDSSKSMLINFLDILSQIAAERFGHEKELRKKIKNEKLLVERNWLIRMIRK